LRWLTVLGLALFFVGLGLLLWPDPLHSLPPWTNLATTDTRIALSFIGSALTLYTLRVPGAAREVFLTSGLILLAFAGISWLPRNYLVPDAGPIFWIWGTTAVSIPFFFAFARMGFRPSLIWGGILLLPVVFSFLGVRAIAYVVLLAGLSLLLERAPQRRRRR